MSPRPLHRRTTFGLTAVLVTLVLLPVSALAAQPAAASATPAGRVIVELDTPFTPPGLLKAADRSRQAQRLAAVRARFLERTPGAKVLRTYDGLPYVALEATAEQIAALAAGPDVAAVRPDRVHQASLAESAPLIGASAAWAAGTDGSGQTVAVLDSGVQRDHPFLAGKVVDEACYASGATCPNGTRTQTGSGAAAPCSFDTTVCPHGTHVAGIVAGTRSSFSGVARGASIAAVQVFTTTTDDCPGTQTVCAVSYTSDLIAALDHVAALSATRPVAAVNMSLGGGSFAGTCDGEDPPLTTAIGALRSLGIASVAAAGNESQTGALSSPACISTAVAVGSTSKTDVVSSFSNASPTLDLLAPGEHITSSWAGSQWAWSSGTSMAAPHVAGAFALLKQARPTASVATMLTALETTGKPILDARNALVRPRVQVDAALVALSAIPDVVPAPAATSTPEPTPAATAPAPPPTSPPVLPVVPEPVVTAAPEPTASAPPTSTPAPETSAPAPISPPPAADPPSAPTSATALRLGGSDRYDTAARIFGARFSCANGGVDSAVLARGDGFADALAGSFLAGTHETGVLLTGTATVPAATLAALRASGARTVYLLGGTSAISAAVARDLAATPSYSCAGDAGAPLEVVRLAGTSRYDTARRIAESAGAAGVGTADPAGTGTPLRTAVLASGLGFADALATGPLSYAGAASARAGDQLGFPTLLTGPTSLAAEAESAVRTLGIQQVIIPGGTVAVGTPVEARLRQLGVTVIRLAGSDRTSTAAAVARFATGRSSSYPVGLGFPTSKIGLARGDGFADALAGASYAGASAVPLLLSASSTALGTAAERYLADTAGAGGTVTAFGGAGAVGQGVLDAATATLQG